MKNKSSYTETSPSYKKQEKNSGPKEKEEEKKKNQIQSYHSHQRRNNNQISIETVTMKTAARLLKYVQSIKFVGGPHPAPSMLHKHFLPIVVQY